MVAGCLLLFVGGIVLLVDHDQTEVVERCKERGAGTDDHFGRAFADPSPLPPAFSVGECGVEDRGLRAEAPFDGARGGGCETDLRHQHETAAASSQHVLETPQVDLCLARTGDALEKKGCVSFLGQGVAHRIDHLLLFIRESVAFTVGSENPSRAAWRGLLESQHQASSVHRPQGRR